MRKKLVLLLVVLSFQITTAFAADTNFNCSIESGKSSTDTIYVKTYPSISVNFIENGNTKILKINYGNFVRADRVVLDEAKSDSRYPGKEFLAGTPFKSRSGEETTNAYADPSVLDGKPGEIVVSSDTIGDGFYSCSIEK
jgi:hypothetical protein